MSYCSTLLKREVPLSAFRIEGVAVYVDLPAILKGEIMIHKEGLLDYINKEFDPKEGKRRFTDVH